MPIRHISCHRSDSAVNTFTVDRNQHHLKKKKLQVTNFAPEQKYWVTYWQQRKPDFAKVV